MFINGEHAILISSEAHATPQATLLYILKNFENPLLSTRLCSKSQGLLGPQTYLILLLILLYFGSGAGPVLIFIYLLLLSLCLFYCLVDWTVCVSVSFCPMCAHVKCASEVSAAHSIKINP
jgi:hypothetical protein